MPQPTSKRISRLWLDLSELQPDGRKALLTHPMAPGRIRLLKEQVDLLSGGRVGPVAS